MKKPIIGIIIISMLASCGSSKKYGCGNGVNPRMTWDRMVDHINRP